MKSKPSTSINLAFRNLSLWNLCKSYETNETNKLNVSLLVSLVS